ncbi:putative transcriptional regulator [Alcanivorax xiamenensis]|uniref:Transcriptional regulator n=1 Tax=Alcanivorax xiamenensis TaxID=1177156 RepID=A0ABQ6Y2L9_9GAMM|nr:MULTISPECIES: TetR/AcrR family transcriptional regulator [Alcanivorax]KAF0802362.1 putative transcriptional regulator [Alcanivorax xiamenensis]
MNTKQRPRQVKPAEVRLDELVSAAQALFLDKGVDATTVGDIVERAGVAKGTFYHYFNAKTDLLPALRERFTRRFLERVNAAVEACGSDDWPGRLSAWFTSSLHAYQADFQLHDLVYAGHHHDRDNPDLDAVVGQVEAILRQGGDAGAWPLSDWQRLATMAYWSMHGLADTAIARGGEDSDELGAFLSRRFLAMLGGVEK